LRSVHILCKDTYYISEELIPMHRHAHCISEINHRSSMQA